MYEIFEKRLSKWKVSSLSIGGRLTIIKSVIECLPNYFFSLYRAPKRVINDLESYIRRFLWGGSSSNRKMHWVAWEKVALPKIKGGLGLCNLRTTNLALLAKWGWRYKNEKNSLWKKVIDAIHVSNRSWDFIPACKSGSSVWRNIVKTLSNSFVEEIPIRSMFKGIVGDGADIAFWIDPWVADLPLKDLAPSLFRLEKSKKCKVQDRLICMGGVLRLNGNGSSGLLIERSWISWSF